MLNFLKTSQSESTVTELKTGYLIVGGDVNCIEEAIDRTSNVTDKNSLELKKIKECLNLTDMWKTRHPVSLTLLTLI